MIRRWQTASAALILLLTNSTTAATARIGIVTSGALNVRAKPARHFERVGKFRRGDAVKVVRETDEWLEVVVPTDAKAWVAKQHLDARGVVIATSLQVRSGPGIVFTTYAKVAKGTTLKLVGPPLDEWQRILPPEGATGWVSRAYVRLQDQRVTVATKPGTPAPAKPGDTSLTVAKVPSKPQPPPPP
ncbi:MAG: SH3 domain-containing protein, partial [Victivallales bacterium]|nr:SH3 domain-containing protein [Victivallales bacterium]